MTEKESWYEGGGWILPLAAVAFMVWLGVLMGPVPVAWGALIATACVPFMYAAALCMAGRLGGTLFYFAMILACPVVLTVGAVLTSPATLPFSGVFYFGPVVMLTFLGVESECLLLPVEIESRWLTVRTFWRGLYLRMPWILRDLYPRAPWLFRGGDYRKLDAIDDAKA